MALSTCTCSSNALAYISRSVSACVPFNLTSASLFSASDIFDFKCSKAALIKARLFSLWLIFSSCATYGSNVAHSFCRTVKAAASYPIASISACLFSIAYLLFASSQSLRAAMSTYNASCTSSCSFASMASCKNLQCAFSISTHPDSFNIATFFSRNCFCSSAFCFSLSKLDLVSLSWKTAAEYSVFAFWYATAFSCISSNSAFFLVYVSAFCLTSPSLTESSIIAFFSSCFFCKAACNSRMFFCSLSACFARFSASCFFVV